MQHSKQRNAIMAICFFAVFYSFKFLSITKLLFLSRTRLGRFVIRTVGIPCILIVDLLKHVSHLVTSRSSGATQGIDESKFADEKEFGRIIQRLGAGPARTTGSNAHNELIAWLEDELRQLPGLELHTDEYEILRWQTKPGSDLKNAGRLTINTSEKAIPIAGVVPFSKPADEQNGQLVYVPRGVPLSSVDIEGKIVLRDLPAYPIPYPLLFLPSHSRTSDLNWDLASNYDRPCQADMPLKEELILAGRAGAAGMIILFDVGRSQVESYFEPHQGVHYQIPAVFVGVDEAIFLKSQALKGNIASISVTAEIQTVKTRNVIATLPGRSPERVIFQSHTDGNTYVQENGPVALLTLAQYYSNQPLSSRGRTIQFAFNTGHLHISREGTARHAEQLSATYNEGTLALIIPVEHLGTREIEPVRRRGKHGYELKFTGRGEMMLWCVGPSPPVVKAVQDAVKRRKLDRVLITRGATTPDTSRVPTYTSFGGIGTYYHNLLLPTTTLVSGPWSLWAPNFGIDAIDISRLRRQTLAVGDIYLALEGVDRIVIEAGYKDYRKRRSEGARGPINLIPEEIAH